MFLGGSLSEIQKSLPALFKWHTFYYLNGFSLLGHYIINTNLSSSINQRDIFTTLFEKRENARFHR